MKSESRNSSRLHRKRRIRAKVFGSAKTPRLCVFRSNREISAQLIDDEKGKTLAAAHSKDVRGKGFDVKVASEVGKKIAQEALKLKIKEVVFDRGGYKYHGKVKELAESARKEGLEF